MIYICSSIALIIALLIFVMSVFKSKIKNKGVRLLIKLTFKINKRRIDTNLLTIREI